jgi:hypothetical protein
MQANAKPEAGPGDDAPGSESSALIKMNNQHTKRGYAMPVRTHGDHSALPHCGRRRAPRPRSPFSSGLAVPS